jgi:hypothetical protein
MDGGLGRVTPFPAPAQKGFELYLYAQLELENWRVEGNGMVLYLDHVSYSYSAFSIYIKLLVTHLFIPTAYT